MEIHIGGRRTGKTTECIKRMNEDSEIHAFVCDERFKIMYPKTFHNRIYSSGSGLMKGVKVEKIIIDELDSMPINNVAHILSTCEDKIVFVTSTPNYSYDRLNTPLREMIRQNNGEYTLLPPRLMTAEQLNICKKILSHNSFMAQIYGFMVPEEELIRRKNQQQAIKAIKSYVDILEMTTDKAY